ncbi:MAG: GAF domain-containing sensor histidine kinase [Caldilineaceae bacterium]
MFYDRGSGMNPISSFLVRNLIFVYFLYGLAFFTMGLALLLVRQRSTSFRLAVALGPLTAFALLHGAHEWYEMFQQIAMLRSSRSAGLLAEEARLALLFSSFLALLWFGVASLVRGRRWRRYLLLGSVTSLWLLAALVVWLVWRPALLEFLGLLDVLARYLLCIPGALLSAWALMAQQRSFREHNFPQFSRDLVWCASAFLLYGVVGQVFVRQTVLPPSTFLNNALFLDWFGIPIQLFRAGMAGVITIYLIRALNIFEVENQQRLAEANRIRLTAQKEALEAERRSVAEISRLNDELRLTAHELSLLLELSNLLVTAQPLPERLKAVLTKIVANLHFTDAGLILLVDRETGKVPVATQTGFIDVDHPDDGVSRYSLTIQLGRRSIAEAKALCYHADSQVLEISLEVNLLQQACAQYTSPTLYIALPLYAQQQVIGSLALARTKATSLRLTPEELRLITGMVQQLGLSIENARLSQQARAREKMVSALLYQAVGAQEAERQRIARELHDATGQSLTAIALGLRGVEGLVGAGNPVSAQQVREIMNFATNALGELRQIIADLRPSQLDDLGLVAALRWYAQEYQRRRNITVTFTVKGEQVRLPSDYETVIFRIIQEALTNIAKHAQATQATLTLDTHPERVCITVQDNGRGFEPSILPKHNERQAGWGLLGMRERALLLGGHCEIQSAPGRGTTIHVEIPLLIGETAVNEDARTGIRN